MEKLSLFERIGGRAAIDAAVDLFYTKILNDPTINHFFEGLDIEKQKIKQRTFLAYAFGAPVKYTGKDMTNAHARLVDNGLNEEHFNAVAGHLVETLKELNVSSELIDEVVSIALSVKEDVLKGNKNNQHKQNESNMALGKNLSREQRSGNEGDNNLYLKLLMEAADAVVTIDETKNVIFWNKAAEKLWGYSESETVGRNINNFVPDEHKRAHDGYVDSNIRTGVDKIVGRGREVEVQRKDGNRVPVLLTMTKVVENEKTFYMATVKDISEDKLVRERAQQAIEEVQAQEEELRQNMEELQATQEAIEKEKRIMQGTLEQAQDAIITIDSNKIILFYNHAAEQMFGFGKDEVMGKNIKMIVPIEHRGNHDNYVDNNLNTGVNKVVGNARDLEATKKDGTRFWINLSLSKIKTDDGYQFTAFVKDITKQKENLLAIEQSQREIEARIAQVNTACIVSEADLKGNILYVNDKLCEVSGYTREECMGQPHSMFRHPDMPKEVFKEMWSTIGKGGIFRGIVKNRKKDGSPYFVDAIIAPVLGPNGKPIKYIGIRYEITDVTLERIDNRGKLDAVDNAYATIEFDTKGNIIEANDIFCKVLGYGKNEIKGRHHRMFVEPEYAASNEYQRFWMDLENGKAQDGQFKRITSSGKEIWIQAVYAPVKDDMGRIIKVVKIATDITTQKTAEFEQIKLIDEINRVATQAGQEGDLDARLKLTNISSANEKVQNTVNELLDNISQPVNELKKLIGEMSRGNLTEEFQLNVKGDIKEMGDAFNQATRNLNELLGNINGIANLVAASSEELLTKADQMQSTTQEVASAIQQMAEGAHQQAAQTDETSKLVEGVMRSSNDMGNKAGFINKAAENGQKSSNDGLITVRRVVDNMEEIQKSANVTSESINVLSQRSEEIARTLNVITDIASQTNLLALNAAIEAARAGDAGRGFAVVAEEIRKLAEDSRKSAIDIERVIREVQKDINQAGKAIDTMESSVKSGNQASKEAEHVFQSIEKSTTETLSLSLEILNATGQQKESINETVKNIEKIVVVSEETAAGSEQIATSSKDLSRGMEEVASTSKDLAGVATQLQEGVSKFRLKK